MPGGVVLSRMFWALSMLRELVLQRRGALLCATRIAISVAHMREARQRDMPLGLLRRALAAVFVGQFVVLDLWSRGLQGLAASPTAAAHVVASVLFWSFLGSACSVTRRRVVVAGLAAADLVVQASFYRYYHAAVDVQVVTAAVRSWSDIRPVLARGMAPYVVIAWGLAVGEFAIISKCVAAFDWSRRVRAGAAFGLVVTAFLGPGRAVAKELSRARGTDRSEHRIEALPSAKATVPSILFLLTESVRASDYCSAHGGACPMAPEVDALVAERTALREMRSLSSYTAVSVEAILSGVVPSGSREGTARAPLLFDFMKAIRTSSGSMSVAYWSAQTASMFERSDLRRLVDSFVTVEDLVGHPVGDEDEVIDQGVDRLLAARAQREMQRIAPPFVALVHFQGTHAPYFVDEKDAPFRPFGHVVTWSGLDELHNAYLDAIHEQDKSVAAIVRQFLAKVGSSPYVILFTSDHGEAFGEHGAIHHGQNLYREQIHVPAWIVAGNGALDTDELAAVRAYEGSLTTHLDLLPTLLDVVGVLRGGALESHRKAMAGRSLIRPRRPLGVVPLTNCTELFRCPLDTWGVMDEKGELTAQAWDADWKCVAAGGSPLEPLDPACVVLRARSRGWFPTKPNGAGNF